MTLHHVELWVPDLPRAIATWGWLLTELGYEQYQDWPDGRSWRAGGTYIVVERSPALTGFRHDRCAPGLNHLAFSVPSRQRVDELVSQAPAHGWRLLFADRHPYAGGPGHYAAYMENDDGYEAELIAAELRVRSWSSPTCRPAPIAAVARAAPPDPTLPDPTLPDPTLPALTLPALTLPDPTLPDLTGPASAGARSPVRTVRAPRRARQASAGQEPPGAALPVGRSRRSGSTGARPP